MSDRSCMTCRAPWDVAMEPDASMKAVQQLLEDDYGEGFKVTDIGGVSWGIKSCPCCPDGAEPDLGAEADALEEMLFD